MANRYIVAIPVHGSYRCCVKAESEEEALMIANEACGEADFGELSNVEWSLGNVVDSMPEDE